MADRRPIALTVLGALQFLAFAVAVVILLGDGTRDGELSTGDIARAVAVALAGAVIVGTTFDGARVGFWVEVVAAVAAVAGGAIAGAGGDERGFPVLAIGVLWLAIVTLPASRTWFLRPVQ